MYQKMPWSVLVNVQFYGFIFQKMKVIHTVNVEYKQRVESGDYIQLNILSHFVREEA